MNWSRLSLLSAAVALPFALSGCFGLNRIPVFTVSVVNDTPGEVVLRDCDDFCSSALLTFDLQPGASVDIHRTTHMHKYFSVTAPTGAHIGCVDLYFTTPRPGARVPVSEAGRCPRGDRLPWATILLITGALAAATIILVRRFRR